MTDKLEAPRSPSKVSINSAWGSWGGVIPQLYLGDARSSARRSAALRAEPLRVSSLRAAAAIAGRFSKLSLRPLEGDEGQTGEAGATNLPTAFENVAVAAILLACLVLPAIFAGA
jgi:hypothetical protein